MTTNILDNAISEALRHGNAVLKFISANDVGATGAHQDGFYIPKPIAEFFTPLKAVKGKNIKHEVRIRWHDEHETQSMFTWYGTGSRSEFRLTRFGKSFPYFNESSAGNLLVLIQTDSNSFLGYVFEHEQEIEEIFAALGLQPFDNWGVFKKGSPQFEKADDGIENRIAKFAEAQKDFPPGSIFSDAARSILEECSGVSKKLSADERLPLYYDTENKLFQAVEKKIFANEIKKGFKNVDEFTSQALSILNRRKTRAGRALENHASFLLAEANVPHEMRPDIDGRPDVVIPNRKAYEDEKYPEDELFIVGVKTTCKDRWRQVLNEGTRIKRKYILTLQPSISATQLEEMHKAGVVLIVPAELRRKYPTNHPLKILSVGEFIELALIKTANKNK